MKKLKNFEISAVRSRKQYKDYLNKVSLLMDNDPSPNSQEGKLLETLVILIEAYEAQQGWEIPTVNDPIKVIRMRMEDLGLRQSDLIKAIGDKTKVSRILNRSRKLTYTMILPLSQVLRIPPEFLLEKAA
jgi:HTH-type transcriptional regulator/antitoxin HigA